LSRTAFVIPWFGRDLLGGAEQHIFQVATRLARRGHHVEVLTTCCRSFRDDWQQNHFPEGTSEEAGVEVRRFPVGPRDAAAFEAANRELVELNERRKLPGVSPVPTRIAQTFVDENIHSPRLLDYLAREGGTYSVIVFAPYLYGPTLRGVERAGDRSVLQPMLHDETYAYLPAVEAIFHRARRVLFNSEGEAMLAARLFGPSIWRKAVLTGEGVEQTETSRAGPLDRHSVPELAPGSYLLYLGRRDRTKNTDLLLRAFRHHRASRPRSVLKLVLAGSGEVPWAGGAREGIVDLGVIAEERKAWLLFHSRALVQPSRNESYSRTVMEAWLHGKPVVVHAGCLATSLPVESSGGGWTADAEHEWAERFAEIEAAGDRELGAVGEKGLLYAREHADWDKAIDRYENALELRQSPPRPRARLSRRRAIHQLLPDLAYGDAISNQALFINELMRDLGYESEIFVENVHESMRGLGRPFTPGAVAPEDGLIYHHSIGTTLTQQAIRHAGPKLLVYHNITPDHFYQPWDARLAGMLEKGRKDLRQLASAFPASAGVSSFNAAELHEAGFRAPAVLPNFVDPLRWGYPADPEWMKRLQDGRTNLLFVGRVAPNKCQHHLLEAFREYLFFDPRARLLLVGGWRDGDAYANFVREQASRLGIASSVVFTRVCTDAQLLACYRTAHLFWSMSEHEGFCMPLVEAMWFDVPVLAYASSAVPETMGAAGLMFTEKRWTELAALAHLLVQDQELRRKLIASQRARRDAFLPETLLPAFLDCLAGALDGRDQVGPDRFVSSDKSSPYASTMRDQR
jgi:glycosyltransferase involved in cell wall biosynthesis